MDAGNEAIADETEKTRLRRQALRVHVESILAAAALTALSLFTPA